MRIDNVAWDVTPAIIKRFLPEKTLARDHPQPIHILLDRFDGRTKDYMYIEAASPEAARKILQTRQNNYMSGGPIDNRRKRPVTISLVSHDELTAELRPTSAQELYGLLALCQAAVCMPGAVSKSISFAAPNGRARFVKWRYGPFNALMSIMSKLKGKQSPAYWDVFQVASGAIAALATSKFPSSSISGSQTQVQDEIIMRKLSNLFKANFGMQPAV
ncbi:MAG: hypothetical protein TREMPRED_000545 [Tremellales sp. Tagirdzhanova-0007]|nr:MAG: hypothetical protein TREMPRED_000545 [Tremellales sp. Tagirdzhanova-0007]